VLKDESLTISASGALGATVVLIITFLRWRYHKNPVARREWDELVSGYLELESLVADVTAKRRAWLSELAAQGQRLEHAVGENNQLRARLQDLHGHLETVTGEATMLVSSLRDNDQRWEQAEAKHRRMEADLVRRTTALEDEVARRCALEEGLAVERAEAKVLRVAHAEIAAQLQEIKQTLPEVDLRDRDWSMRRWRRAPLRAGRLSSQSHGQLPG
jgi:chromosome segregation ATPase